MTGSKRKASSVAALALVSDADLLAELVEAVDRLWLTLTVLDMCDAGRPRMLARVARARNDVWHSCVPGDRTGIALRSRMAATTQHASLLLALNDMGRDAQDVAKAFGVHPSTAYRARAKLRRIRAAVRRIRAREER